MNFNPNTATGNDLENLVLMLGVEISNVQQELIEWKERALYAEERLKEANNFIDSLIPDYRED